MSRATQPLGVGTLVSAKYRGTWCEGVIKRVMPATQLAVVFGNQSKTVKISSTDVTKGTIASGVSEDEYDTSCDLVQ